MPATILSKSTIFIDPALTREADDIATSSPTTSTSIASITLSNGEVITPSPEFGSLLFDLMTRLRHGTASVKTLPEELSTISAAEIVGISRPTLMKCIAEGELPATKVGSHTRVRTADVLALRDQRRAKRARAIADLRRLDDIIDAQN